jgi:PhnB protein
MANSSLPEQLELLDQALSRIFADPEAPLLASEAEIEPLLRIAAELRDLPRQEFRSRLKDDLAGKAPLPAVAQPAATVHKTTATTYLCVRDAAAAIEFYKTAFGATELMRITGADDKIMHACITIDGAPIMLADEFPEVGFVSPQSLGGSPVKIHLDVADIDTLAKQAVAAGVKEVRPVQDQFYGARSGQFADPFGYTWILSTRTEDVTFAEMQRRFDALQVKEDQSAVLKEDTLVNPIRQGFRTVTPYLTVANVHEEIDFLRRVFGAEGQVYGLGSAGGFHSEYKIGDSMLMIGGGGEGSSWRGTPAPAALHIYVADVDAVYQRALEAGATSLHPPQDQPYGERSAAIRDVGGNEWYPATYKGAHYMPEGVQNLMAYLHPRGAAKQMDFLKQAFGAEEVGRGESPDGIIYHAQVRIGNSIVEMGEAHDQWQPMPMHFMLYVDDVDAWYARAIRAEGVVSVSQPADQSYGDRTGAVKDPFDNVWYLSSHIREITGAY